jgi:aspartate/methionine/tyrosine aminotransferase
VKLVFNMLIRGGNDGIMIPIPQYPLYSALITLNGGKQIPYFLDETQNWSLDTNDVKKKITEAKKAGVDIRCIVIINPGNPTGQVLSKANIEEIIDICHQNNILIIADEVYQNNVYKKGLEFVSFRKVLNEMPSHIRDSVELLSLNSVSKGLLGECGFRGGYMEAHNIDEFASEQLYKLKSVELCSNTIGQVTTLLLVDPPKRGVESDATVDKFEKEKSDIFDGLRTRAELLSKTFNEMEKVTCSEIQGAMYAFPRVHLSDSAVKAAKAMGVAPDFMYCHDLVNETGIMTVPGSGFGQKEGEYHFRITNLVCPTERMQATLENLKVFNAQFHAKYK